MKQLHRILAIAVAAFLLFRPPIVWAGENEMMDILLQKLVEKEVLSREDEKEIRKEVAEEANRMYKSREAESKDAVKKMAGGSWLDKVKWSGDLRLRHETQRREPAVDRSRERFRLRFGFKANPIDPLEIGVRLATGTAGDPVSTNQSFTATFDKKAIFVDQAYAKYTPWSWVSLTGGKMENPFVIIPESVAWDHDVTPEGVAVQLKSPNPIPVLDQLLPVTPFANVGAFAITELSADNGDPGLFGYQGGADIGLPFWDMTFQPSIAYYDFTAIDRINTANVTNAPAGNTTVTKGTARYFASDYNLVSTVGKLTIPSVLGQPVSFLADYTYNNDNRPATLTDQNVDDDGGYTAGLEVGKVTEKFGSWKASYFRKRIETDAAFGAISDSDFGGGGTNHKGHILGLQLGLNKYASIGLKYFRTDEIEGTQNRFDTFQADLQLKY